MALKCLVLIFDDPVCGLATQQRQWIVAAERHAAEPE